MIQTLARRHRDAARKIFTAHRAPVFTGDRADYHRIVKHCIHSNSTRENDPQVVVKVRGKIKKKKDFEGNKQNNCTALSTGCA